MVEILVIYYKIIYSTPSELIYNYYINILIWGDCYGI
ncbi:hypothetical protein [Clostridium phage slur17]|uniref:Uncharacterized protein n=1 Tax=Clostridium phage slur17 TaxID=1720506 RepID=A0A1J1J8Q6_9CAUD|nr:hypothetical protein [Clostridium phage slur17]